MPSRIPPVDPAQAGDKARELLDAVQKKMGRQPNIMKVMANAPALLDAYLALGGALFKGALDLRTRESLALAIGEKNSCQYCVSAHTAMAKGAGLSDEDAMAARRGQSSDPKRAAAIKLALSIMEKNGYVEDAELDAARAAGLDNEEIMEIIAVIALNIMTNLVNHVADTEVDFPEAPELA